MKNLQNSMLKKGKKGFTLTELAIVIAVIAILIAVLVPSFTSIITNARKTAAAEEAKSAISVYVSETYTALDDEAVIKSGDYYFIVESGSVSTDNLGDEDDVTDMVAYVWDSTGDLANSDITIYVSADYAAKYASSVNGFNGNYTAAKAYAETNYSSISSSETIYVVNNTTMTIWWTVDSFTISGSNHAANLTSGSGTISVDGTSGSIALSVDGTPKATGLTSIVGTDYTIYYAAA